MKKRQKNKFNLSILVFKSHHTLKTTYDILGYNLYI